MMVADKRGLTYGLQGCLLDFFIHHFCRSEESFNNKVSLLFNSKVLSRQGNSP